MNEELILKAMDLFDSADKWNSFCELMSKDQEIQNRWWKRLQTEVYQRENTQPNPDWAIHKWNAWDIRWYIKGESENSLAVHFWGDRFRVFANYGALDLHKVNKLLENPKFDVLKTCFDRLDGSDYQTIGWEDRNFRFKTIYDERFPDARTLSWYAGNRTKEFADQIIAKVRKFQTPEITALFKEINSACKRNEE
ncbi:MAG: hypothetical protein J5I98_29905 [Phaeodactylibacter sp.]|nr:hypothetical protein [Phaeodactylibacter sp.]